MTHADLDTVVDRALRELPVPRAPLTLLPRVLAAVEAWTMRSWYERAWFTWPLVWQAVSVALFVLLVGGTALLWPTARTIAADAASTFAPDVMSSMAGIGQRLDRALRAVALAAEAARVLWRTLVEPFVTYMFALVALMCLACAAFATALNHVVFGKALLR